MGGSSYIDSVIFRDRDVIEDWVDEADEVRDERLYYCQNWRADVSAILTDAGSMVEWVKYSVYGVPFALPAGDTDSDGDYDLTDRNNIDGWTTGYDVRHDANIDGVIDKFDDDHAASITGGYQTLGRGVLSSSAINNRRGYAGYEYDPTLEGAGRWLYHVRHRVYDAEVGRWTRRDPLGYVDGMSLYEYVRGMAVRGVDPMGLDTVTSGGGGSCAAGKCGSDSKSGDRQPNTWDKYRECLDPFRYGTRPSCEKCCLDAYNTTANPVLDFIGLAVCLSGCRDPADWGDCDDGTYRGNCWSYAICQPLPPGPVDGPHRMPLPGVIYPLLFANPCGGCPSCDTIRMSIQLCGVGIPQPLFPGGSCPAGSHKIRISTISTGGQCDECMDIHFSRQNPDGTWTERRGCQPPALCPPGVVHPGYKDCGEMCVRS